MPTQPGRHFLQIPGPTNIPGRILRAMSAPTIDHRGPEFEDLTREILGGLKDVFKTRGPVIVFPGSGSGAWEAAFVNTLSAGDKVLAFETGQFATAWRNMAIELGLEVDFVETDWRRGVDPAVVEAKLRADAGGEIHAVLAVHNETSTGVTSDIAEVRRAIDRTGHSALLFVDAISSLACIDLRHDEWGVDVTICGSQKGLMLPPGLAFNAVSEKALKAAKGAGLPKSYWNWEAILTTNQADYFPYTPATNLLFGLREALRMLAEEGLDNVFARHGRLAEATRRAARSWGLEMVCADPRQHSDSVSALFMPEGHDADAYRRLVFERYNVALGAGLGKLKGRVFRIGHLGDFNEAMLAGTLGAVEMGLACAGVPFSRGGVQAALDYLAGDAA